MSNQRRKSKQRHNSKKRVQKGGDVIGHGGYGCVIYPNISCYKWPSSKDYISKLVNKSSEDSESTIIDVLKIRNIPEYDQYFAIIMGICELNKDTVLTDQQKKDVEKCMKKFDIQEIDQLLQYIQPYGGITMQKYRDAHKRQPIAEATGLYLRLLKCLHVLNEHDIQHMDIKMDNIVIQPDTGLLRLIDFGFACSVRESVNMRRPDIFMRDYYDIIDGGYPPWPVEFFIFEYLHTYRFSKPTKFVYDYYPQFTDITDKNVKAQMERTIDNTFSSKKGPYHKLFVENFINDGINMSDEMDQIEKIGDEEERRSAIVEWKNAMNQTFDVYSAGIVIVKDIDFLLTKRAPATRQEEEFVDSLFRYVINHMCRIYYRHRSTLEDCMVEINRIYQSYINSIPASRSRQNSASSRSGSRQRRSSPKSKQATPSNTSK